MSSWDVVYNHVYQADEYAFEQIVPGYFYRYNAEGERTNGTFCGNDVASERSMVRHYPAIPQTMGFPLALMVSALT